MGFETHYKQMYADALLDLAGFQNRTYLKNYVSMESKGGKVVYFDEMAPLDEAEKNAMSGTSHYRKDYEEIATPDLADWVGIKTPHQEVTRQRTFCSPTEIAMSHIFRDKDEIAENSNPQSDTIRNMQRNVLKREDEMILDAITGATQQRGEDFADVAAVPFPAGQIVAGARTFDKEYIIDVVTKFETQYIDQDIFMIISPAQKNELIRNSGSAIQSSDFIDGKTGTLEKGGLPDIYGVKMIVHPLVSNYFDGHTFRCFAWCADAIKYNQSRSLEVNMGQDPGERFQVKLFMNEFVGTCRRDDLKVVWVESDII